MLAYLSHQYGKRIIVYCGGVPAAIHVANRSTSSKQFLYSTDMQHDTMEQPSQLAKYLQQYTQEFSQVVCRFICE